MSSSRIVYIPRPDATYEAELSALADVYSFAMRCAEEKEKGGPETAPGDAERRSNEIRATSDCIR